MPVVQDTFATDFAKGFPGMVANGETSNRITRTAIDAAGIKFGAPGFRGANDRQVSTVVGVGATKFLGIVIVDHGNVSGIAGTPDGYGQYQNVPLIQRGSVWVLNGATPVLAGDTVAVLNADGTYTKTGAGATDLPGWVWDDTTAAGAIGRITNNRHAPV